MKSYILILSITLLSISCTKRTDLDAYTLPIENNGGSVCGVPMFGCLHGVKLLDNTTHVSGDTVIVKMFLKKLDYKMDTGKWYANSDQVVSIQFIKGNITTASVGKPSGEDSIKLNKLLDK